ncbi:MAG: hypothetical protein AAFX39_08500 [Pseudomonadota bacterium]
MKTKKLDLQSVRPIAADNDIRAVLVCPRGGHIVTMGFPGLAVGFDGTSYIDLEALNATLDDPSLSGSTLLIALAETLEFPDDHWRSLQDALDQRGRRLDHMPIEDFSVPDAKFIEQWPDCSKEYHHILDRGGTIGITCHYGAGRSGTIAAHLMIERGIDPDDAIARVRNAFPDSIESRTQFNWLQKHG